MKGSGLYESDLTRFMRELFERNPQLEEDQKKGRAIWWDKQVDFEELEREKASELPQPAYPYFDIGRPANRVKH